MPIIATVPACAGTTALIAVPPCEAPQATLNDKLRGAQDVSPGEADECGLGGLQRESGDQPVSGDVPDAPDDIGDPAPQVTEHVGEHERGH
jgi:hypothetical protein